MSNFTQLEKYKLIMNDLYKFYNYFVINYFNKKIIPAPHIEKLSRELMKMYRGDYKKLTVSMPPRHSKSSLITLAFPLWLISKDPTLNIMVINSTFTLSESFGIRIRDLFHQYGEKIGLRISDKKHASGWIMFEDLEGNLTGGSIRLIGIGGQITGFDADWIIVDDLIKGVQDTTKTTLQKTKDYFNGIIMQRVEPDTRLIVLGTIWHSDDILSYLRKEHGDEYVIMDLPAYDNEGNVLWPDRYDMDFFVNREKEMGTRLFQALYLCNPLDETGDFFNLDNIFFDDLFDHKTHYTMATVRSWDFAYSEEDGGKNDSTAGILMHKINDDYYVINNLIYGQFGDNLKNKVVSIAKQDGVNIKILIETGTKGGAAKFLYDDYEKEYLKGYRTKQSEPIGSKVDRATPFKDAINDGKIHIAVTNDDMRAAIIEQLKSFPLGAHDDIIDAMSYAYSELHDTKSMHVGTTKRKHGRRRQR